MLLELYNSSPSEQGGDLKAILFWGAWRGNLILVAVCFIFFLQNRPGCVFKVRSAACAALALSSLTFVGRGGVKVRWEVFQRKLWKRGHRCFGESFVEKIRWIFFPLKFFQRHWWLHGKHHELGNRTFLLLNFTKDASLSRWEDCVALAGPNLWKMKKTTLGFWLGLHTLRVVNSPEMCTISDGVCETLRFRQRICLHPFPNDTAWGLCSLRCKIDCIIHHDFMVSLCLCLSRTSRCTCWHGGRSTWRNRIC